MNPDNLLPLKADIFPSLDGNVFAQAMGAARTPMVLSDATAQDCPIVFVNDAFLNLTGYSRKDVLGRNCRFLQGPETDRHDVHILSDALKERRHIDMEILNYRKDGSCFWNALHISPIHDERGNLISFFGLQRDITTKTKTTVSLSASHTTLENVVVERTRDLQHALDQKTVLLHEVDHRVKNNLQLIGSLIFLQSRKIQDPDIRSALHDMLERISALSTVHRRLYQSGDVSRFEVSDFIRDLVGDILSAADATNLKLDLDLHPVTVPAAKASSLALLINEFVGLAIRRASSSDSAIDLSITTRQSNKSFSIEIVTDQSQTVSISSAHAFGQTMIELLTKQLRAHIKEGIMNQKTFVRIELLVE